MKKYTAFALAGILAMSMAGSAQAAVLNPSTAESGSASHSFDIHAKTVTDATEGISVISVDLTYGAMNFVYVTSSEKGVWDPNSHTYGEEISSSQWIVENESNEITVTNHSNKPVLIALEAETSLTTEFKVGDEEMGSFELEKGEAGKYAEAPTKTATLNLSGEPTNNTLTNDFKTVGSVTVTISEKKNV